MAPINQINTTQKLASLSRKHLYDVDKTANSDPPRVYSKILLTINILKLQVLDFRQWVTIIRILKLTTIMILGLQNTQVLISK
jgi:hypothetical protein